MLRPMKTGQVNSENNCLHHAKKWITIYCAHHFNKFNPLNFCSILHQFWNIFLHLFLNVFKLLYWNWLTFFNTSFYFSFYYYADVYRFRIILVVILHCLELIDSEYSFKVQRKNFRQGMWWLKPEGCELHHFHREPISTFF